MCISTRIRHCVPFLTGDKLFIFLNMHQLSIGSVNYIYITLYLLLIIICLHNSDVTRQFLGMCIIHDQVAS